MTARRLLISFLALALSGEALRAEEAPAQDYSRATLLYIFSQEGDESDEPDMKFEYTAKNWTFRWLPFLTPIDPNHSFGSASIMPPVDPFALLGLEFPQTAETYPDRGPQTRYRRRMLRTVTAANRADNVRRTRGGG